MDGDGEVVVYRMRHSGLETLVEDRRPCPSRCAASVVDDEHRFGSFCACILRGGPRGGRGRNDLDALSRLRRGDRPRARRRDAPELDGFEVVRRIRTESAMPIILITARGEEAQRTPAWSQCHDYVVSRSRRRRWSRGCGRSCAARAGTSARGSRFGSGPWSSTRKRGG